ncbi:MAG: polymer-forming cytoskeletal protein [Sideroxyarcus sp.]|nr:polymer-forming cytoskeletal protein [Sideroxyarcus sp.]
MGKDHAETIIGPSVHVEGNFQGAGDLIVEGSIAGTVKTSGNIRIGEQAKVKADIEGANVFVAGDVRGNVLSTGQLELTPSARVQGNVTAEVLVVAAGAKLQGKCSMNGKRAGSDGREEHADDGKSE